MMMLLMLQSLSYLPEQDKTGKTRLDLVNKNAAIFKSIIPEIAREIFPELCW